MFHCAEDTNIVFAGINYLLISFKSYYHITILYVDLETTINSIEIAVPVEMPACPHCFRSPQSTLK